MNQEDRVRRICLVALLILIALIIGSGFSDEAGDTEQAAQTAAETRRIQEEAARLEAAEQAAETSIAQEKAAARKRREREGEN
jgi:cytochrome oxidase Cu insertion factor (SCO1/SenC/PrrC family)